MEIERRAPCGTRAKRRIGLKMNFRILEPVEPVLVV
jgi:hypothetical protein